MKKVLSLMAVLFFLAFPIHATVTDTESPVKIYTTATVTEYPIPFDYIDDEDIEVTLVNATTGAETAQTLDVDYTIVSSTVTYSVAPGSAYKVVIRRVTPYTQEASWVAGSAPPLSAYESAFDKLTYLTQDLNERLERSILLPKTTTLSNLVFPDPADYPGLYLRNNSSGTGIEAVNLGGSGLTINVHKLSDYDSLDDMLTDLGSTETTVFVDTVGTLTADTTFPSTLHIIMLKGGAFTLGAYDLTINGPFDASVSQVFNCASSGVVKGLSEARPEWWGIDGTADDVQINAAAASLTAGGVVILSKRDYSLDATISIPSSVTLRGVGRKASRLVINTAGIVAVTPVTSGSDIAIEDLGITGTNPITSNNEKGIYATTVTRLHVRGCYFEHLPYSVKYDGCIRSSVRECDFEDTAGAASQGTAVLLGADAEEIIVANNTFKEINRHAIYLSTGTRNSVITSNVIEGCANVAIAMNSEDTDNPNAYNTISNNTIRNITGATGRGISVVDYSIHNTIIGNTIETVSQYGIALEGEQTYALAKNPTGNIITGNTIIAPTSTGIFINNSHDTLVNGNTVVSGVGTGIAVSTSGSDTGSYSYRNRIVNNIVSTCKRGISVSGNADGTFLNANNLYNNTTNAYYLAGGTNTRLEEVFYQSFANHSSSGTGEDTLGTTTIPAYYMGANGGLRVTAAGTKTGSNGNKTIIFYWHSTAITFHVAANNTNDWYFEAEIVNIADNAQRISWRGWDGTTITQGYETATQGTTSDRTVRLTGTCANGSDVITQTMFQVDRF